VFAAVFAVLFIGSSEMPHAWGLLGAGLMLSANLLVALKPAAPPEPLHGAPIPPGAGSRPDVAPPPRDLRGPNA
jgi:hypothetical protein